MLKLMLGRARTGKTTKLLDALRANGGRRTQVLIVPEQDSHNYERLLCSVCGPSASRYAEVLSFTRLANRVFRQAGGLARPVLDAGGRLLLMSLAVSAVQGQLQVYARPSRKAAFLQQLLATSDELKTCCVSPQELLDAGESRLQDLGLILTAYEALVSRQAMDPRDRLTLMAQTLETCPWFRGKDVYLDAFTDFTPQQRLVLSRMLAQAASVTVALTCDTLEEGERLFLPSRRTALALIQLAREARCGMEYEVLQGRADGAAPWLRHLEAHLYADAAPCGEPEGSICLYRAEDPYAEAEWTAGEILRLVHDRGWHFRDIAVTCRTLSDYEAALDTVFRRYQIPLFLGRMDPVLEKPVLTLLTSALDAVNGGYEYEDLFRYLKTGLTGVPREALDELENYVLCWRIRGKKWTRPEPWSWHPLGYALPWRDEERELVERLDALRREIIAPLQRLGEHRHGTGAELAQALCSFLEEIALPQRLSERSAQLREQGELQQAEEYRQLWDILTDALEQCSRLLSEQIMELDYFSELFRLVLSQYDVGSIPVSLDRVSAGELARLNRISCKAMFVLGVDDEHFPLVSQSPGLLTDEDRLLLTERGLTLAATAEQRLDREQTLAYDALTRPEALLVLTCPRQSGGAERRPAVLWHRLEAMFPNLPRGTERMENRLLAPLPAAELAAEREDWPLLEHLGALPGWEQLPQRVYEASRWSRGKLSSAGVYDLYTNRADFSASKMDQLKSCHFAYFCQYGLKAKPRRRAGFDAPESGTFVHDVLEHVLRDARQEGGAAALDQTRLQALIRQAVERYIKENLGDMEEQSPRFRYLFRRMIRSVEVIVENVVEELRCSRFEPIDFELGFGRGKELPPVQIQVEGITLSISGFVDRVDGWEQNGRLYLRVVDYKTGKKSFSLTDVWHGLSLQMLLYLFTLQERGEARYDRPVLPAGVLYLPARDLLLPAERRMDLDQRQREADKALRRSGLLLNDEAVLWAMEQWGESGPRFLPIKVSSKSGITGDALATAEQWGRLKKRLDALLRDMGREIARGDVDADPWQKPGGLSACDWCDYGQCCHFEEGRGSDCRRWLYTVKGKEFWEQTGDGEVEQ